MPPSDGSVADTQSLISCGAQWLHHYRTWHKPTLEWRHKLWFRTRVSSLVWSVWVSVLWVLEVFVKKWCCVVIMLMSPSAHVNDDPTRTCLLQRMDSYRFTDYFDDSLAMITTQHNTTLLISSYVRSWLPCPLSGHWVRSSLSPMTRRMICPLEGTVSHRFTTTSTTQHNIQRTNITNTSNTLSTHSSLTHMPSDDLKGINLCFGFKLMVNVFTQTTD